MALKAALLKFPALITATCMGPMMAICCSSSSVLRCLGVGRKSSLKVRVEPRSRTSASLRRTYRRGSLVRIQGRVSAGFQGFHGEPLPNAVGKQQD